MAVKQDYIMRMIEDGVRFLGRLLLGKDIPQYELPKEEHYSPADSLYARLLALANQGNINEAENELLMFIEGRELDYLELALSFYQHLAEMEEDFLEEHNYSHEEVRDGINSLARACNVRGIEL